MRRIISQADGLKPHLIAPEAGYRRLLQEGLKLMRDPAQNAVEEVHRILLTIIDLAVHTERCQQLSKYSALITEITNCAVTQLGKLLVQIRNLAGFSPYAPWFYLGFCLVLYYIFIIIQSNTPFDSKCAAA